jgi:hypothetical protein
MERTPVVTSYEGTKKYTTPLLCLAVFLCGLFLFGLFKNIAHPLLWGDESMTAMGSERVLQFGYPKVHDGKNVFYDLLNKTHPTIGINEKDDAYVGGAGWGQYYFGTIGYKLSEGMDDFYTKTGIYRSTFALIGFLGLLFILFFQTRFFPNRFSKYLFITLFFFMELASISLVLHMKEVRYYSLVIFFTALIMGLYIQYRFYKPFNSILFIAIEVVALWMLFLTFAPVYFIVMMTLGLSELIIGLHQLNKANFKVAFKKAMPGILTLVISILSVFPLLSYFKTFEISKAMAEYNRFTNEKYWENVSHSIDYFADFEFLYLAIFLKVLTVIHFKKSWMANSALMKVSAFLMLFFILSILAIAKLPNFIYVRYIIYLQPFFAIMIILDLFTLWRTYSSFNKKFHTLRLTLLAILPALMVIFVMISNLEVYKGRVYELFHPYQGPLDYTIPYIKETYPHPDSLVIAANYEETSYMYYLKSKVIIGYVGNNIAEDSLMIPDILAHRKPWGNWTRVFNKFVGEATYLPKGFPVHDSNCNTLPELNFKPSLNHSFRTRLPVTEKDSTFLYLKQ